MCLVKVQAREMSNILYIYIYIYIYIVRTHPNFPNHHGLNTSIEKCDLMNDPGWYNFLKTKFESFTC